MDSVMFSIMKYFLKCGRDIVVKLMIFLLLINGGWKEVFGILIGVVLLRL